MKKELITRCNNAKNSMYLFKYVFAYAPHIFRLYAETESNFESKI